MKPKRYQVRFKGLKILQELVGGSNETRPHLNNDFERNDNLAPFFNSKGCTWYNLKRRDMKAIEGVFLELVDRLHELGLDHPELVRGPVTVTESTEYRSLPKGPAKLKKKKVA